ncbi:MAG: chloride channel protein [Acidimicrobiales bacterium]|nr:chloride channel protein [Acidimicrobiales bacterium]
MPLRDLLPGAADRGRTARLLAVSMLTGILVALVVAAFEVLTADVLLERLAEQPLWVVAAAPTLGLGAAALTLRWLAGGAGPATSDEYIRAYHERRPRLPFRLLPARLLAGAATIGSGGALGLEGPSIYAGSVTGLAVHRRLSRLLRREDAHLLLTAGAAAGVAAVFKAPATGVLFALEAPYRGDLARRALLPALVAAAASYTTYVAIVGIEPVIPFATLEQLVSGEEGGLISPSDVQAVLRVELTDLAGALALGIAAGIGGRIVARVARWAKERGERHHVLARIVAAGVVLAALAVAAEAAFDAPLTTGPGLGAVEWVTQPDQGLGLIALLFGMRLAATTATLVGGGVGGLFIPLAVQGAILGAFIGELVDTDRPLLYATLGVAASLGAGYRTPIAAVMFVAEVAPSGGFVVPALVAAAVSQLVAGRSSVAAHQRDERLGHLEVRFGRSSSTGTCWDGARRSCRSWTAASTSAWCCSTTSGTCTATRGRPRPSPPSPASTSRPPTRAGRSATRWLRWRMPRPRAWRCAPVNGSTSGWWTRPTSSSWTGSWTRRAAEATRSAGAGVSPRRPPRRRTRRRSDRRDRRRGLRRRHRPRPDGTRRF